MGRTGSISADWVKKDTNAQISGEHEPDQHPDVFKVPKQGSSKLVIGRNELRLDFFRTRFGQVGQIEARGEVRFRLGLSAVEVTRFCRLRGRIPASWRIQRSEIQSKESH